MSFLLNIILWESLMADFALARVQGGVRQNREATNEITESFVHTSIFLSTTPNLL